MGSFFPRVGTGAEYKLERRVLAAGLSTSELKREWPLNSVVIFVDPWLRIRENDNWEFLDR